MKTKFSIPNSHSKFQILNSKFFSSRSARKGFTLMETIIVIGITAVIAGIGISSYIGQQRAKLLDSAAKEIVGYLRYAQQKSITQEDGGQWGVHFENPADGKDFYALYTGETYSSPTETKYLPAGITFQTPCLGDSVDMSFEKLIGFLSAETYKQVILKDSSEKTKNILVCKQGLISYDEDIDICAATVDDTAPVVTNITASNTLYGSYVDSPFDLSADINEGEGGLLSCEYTINGGTDWYISTISGYGPSYTCTQTGIISADGSSLILNMRATSGGGTGTGTAIEKTVDAVAPTCSDNWTDNWTVTSPVNITINCNDAKSGVAFTKYCIDTINACSPMTSYTDVVSVSCGSGNVCTQYIRYYAQDNVVNISSIYSKRIRQDKQVPTDGTLSATPGNENILLSWTAASDGSGSGLATTNTYKLVFSTSDYPDANCSSGSQIYLGTDISYPHTGLTNDIPYYYRVCAFDAVNNVSVGVTASGTPCLLANGETCVQGSDCSSGFCYVDEDGDRYAPESGTKKCQANSQIAGTDCCDSDSRVYPGESTYYTSLNNCGSWDYDCNEATSKNSNCSKQSVTTGSPNSCRNYVSTYSCSTTSYTRYVTCEESSAGTASCGQSHSYYYCHSNTCYGYNVDDECVAGYPGVYDKYWITKTCGCK